MDLWLECPRWTEREGEGFRFRLATRDSGRRATGGFQSSLVPQGSTGRPRRRNPMDHIHMVSNCLKRAVIANRVCHHAGFERCAGGYRKLFVEAVVIEYPIRRPEMRRCCPKFVISASLGIFC